MKHIKLKLVMLSTLLLALGNAGGQTAPAPLRLDDLRKQFETTIRDVQRQERETAKQLQQRYLAGLTALEESLQAAGNQLTAVLAVNAERKRFEGAGDIPESALAQQPPALRKLQDAWRAQTAGGPREQAQKIVAASERYLQNLALLQKEAAARNDTRGVDEVKAEKDRVLGNNRVREALTLLQSAPPPSPPPVPPAPPPANRTAPPPTHPKFDVTKDFSVKENPAKSWSYGWAKKPGDAFHLYIKRYSDKTFPVIHGWKVNELPVVGINTGEETLHPSGTTFRSRQVVLHPGPSGECSVIRWMAVRAGTVSITGAFSGMSGYNYAPVTTTDVHVYHNKKEVFGSYVNLQGQGNKSPFDVKVTVQMGDAIYFVVGTGNGTHYSDSTGLEAVIDYTP